MLQNLLGLNNSQDCTTRVHDGNLCYMMIDFIIKLDLERELSINYETQQILGYGGGSEIEPLPFNLT